MVEHDFALPGTKQNSDLAERDFRVLLRIRPGFGVPLPPRRHMTSFIRDAPAVSIRDAHPFIDDRLTRLATPRGVLDTAEGTRITGHTSGCSMGSL